MDAILAAAKIDPNVNPIIDYNCIYVTGGYIESLYGHDSPWGAQSNGWVYLVNGVKPNVGSAIYGASTAYPLQNGDAIQWRWTYMDPVTGVSLNESSATVNVGGAATLTATISPADATDTTLIWTSSNTSIATVEAAGTPSGSTSSGADSGALNNTVGTVTGVSTGTAQITVASEDGGFTATCSVTVQAALGGAGTVSTGSNNGITLNENKVTIAIGTSEKLAATITATADAGKQLIWSSGNEDVATVDQNGMVTGIAAGSATITVSTAGDDIEATCVVTVVTAEQLAAAPPPVPAPSSATASATTFKDLPTGYWARDAVERLVYGDYLKGYGDGTFRPGQPVTRAEFAAMVVKVAGLQEASGMAVFSDVYRGEWYYSVVNACFAEGLIAGYSDGRFGPTDQVTREQAASIIARVLELKKSQPGGQQSTTAKDDQILAQLTDASEISTWAKPAVAMVIGEGLIHGYRDGAFRPKSPATRAECAVMLDKLVTDLAQIR
jgi:uncharacterized protein YjdB